MASPSSGPKAPTHSHQPLLWCLTSLDTRLGGTSTGKSPTSIPELPDHTVLTLFGVWVLLAHHSNRLPLPSRRHQRGKGGGLDGTVSGGAARGSSSKWAAGRAAEDRRRPGRWGGAMRMLKSAEKRRLEVAGRASLAGAGRGVVRSGMSAARNFFSHEKCDTCIKCADDAHVSCWEWSNKLPENLPGGNQNFGCLGNTCKSKNPTIPAQHTLPS